MATARALPLRTRGPGWLRMAARRSSRAAIWCQWLALFCVPYLAIVVLGHRAGAIETPATLWLLGLAAVLLVLALVLGMVGFHDLWTHGHRGGLRALRGTTLAALMLLPFAYFTVLAFTLPPLHDVTTDLADPPVFETAEADRPPGANPIGAPDAERQLAAYPSLAARRYTGDIDLVLKTVIELVTERDWTVLAEAVEERVDPIDVEDSAASARPLLDDAGAPLRLAVPRARPIRGVESEAAPGGSEATDPSDPTNPGDLGAPTDLGATTGTGPVAADEASGAPGASVTPGGGDLSRVRTRDEADERYVEAVAISDILGFPSDVVIRLVEVDDVTIVDMRSASRYGAHDLGANAARIEAFLEDLDEALGNLSSG